MALSQKQVYAAARAGGFTPAQAVIATAIAMAESGGNPSATHRNANGSVDYGLWQINSVHADLLKANPNWQDPKTNARMAHSVYATGGGWRAWSTYKSGAYKSHLSTQANLSGGSVPAPMYAPGFNPGKGGVYQTDAQGNVIRQIGTTGSGTSGSVQDVGFGDNLGKGLEKLGGLSGMGLLFGVNPISKASDVLNIFLSVAFWERAGYLLLGVMLIIMGMVLMVGSNKNVQGIATKAAMV